MSERPWWWPMFVWNRPRAWRSGYYAGLVAGVNIGYRLARLVEMYGRFKQGER